LSLKKIKIFSYLNFGQGYHFRKIILKHLLTSDLIGDKTKDFPLIVCHPNWEKPALSFDILRPNSSLAFSQSLINPKST
jgi:hypothetical protein